MDVRIVPKTLPSLEATRLLQQTSLQGRIKRRLGWKAIALDLEAAGPRFSS